MDPEIRRAERQMERKAKTGLVLRRAATPVPDDRSLSYIGGLPRLPPDMSWPTVPRRMEDGPGDEPVWPTFLAQIDVSDLPEWKERRVFPKTGTFYFFCNTELTGVGDPYCKVLFHPGSSAGFPEREPPPRLMRMYGVSQREINRPWFADGDPRAGVELKYALSFSRETFEEISFEFERAEWTKGSELIPSPGVWFHSWPLTPIYFQTFRDGIISIVERFRVDYGGQVWSGFADAMALCQALPKPPGGDPFRLLGEDERLALQNAFLDFAANLHQLSEEKAREEKGNYLHGSYKIADVLKESAFFSTAKGFAEGRFDRDTDQGRLYRGMVQTSERWRTSSMTPYEMLGVGTAVQEAPYEHIDDLLLLQITGSDYLGWCHPGCVLQLWISPDDMKARNFDSVIATLECG